MTTTLTASPELPELDHLEALARAADQGDGQHIYTNPRDSNGWQANEAWHRATSPAAVLALIALARRAQPEGEAPLVEGDAIARSKRILHLVDEYVEQQTAGRRTALRCALMDQFSRDITSHQLLEVARATGLRQFLHGVNATDARQLLADFVAAVPAAACGVQQAAAPGALAIEAAKLAPILRGMCEGGDVHGDGVDIYADGYIAGDGDTYVVRAAALLEQIAATSAPVTPEAPKKPAHGHRDDYYLLSNGRRLGLEPISRVRNMPNWVLAMELFATGCTSAHQLCRDAGVDPDSTTTQRAAAQKGGA